LVERPHGLIRNHFEAWQYGPVIRSVYEAFKPFRDRAITAPATFLDYASGQQRPVPFEDIKSDDAELIAGVCKTYANFTTGRLVALSHQESGAWDTVFTAHSKRNQSNLRISNDLIRREFLNEAVGKVQH
jgi:uncharacterized phage-associated protein